MGLFEMMICFWENITMLCVRRGAGVSADCSGRLAAGGSVSEYDTLEKRASEAPAVRCIETRKPVAVSEPAAGVYVYDFGQNFNGNCEIVLRNTEKKQGQTVTIRYAEALNDSRMTCRDDAVGTIWTQNLYTAKNTDYYRMSGAGRETYLPKLVCRGFRYVQITGGG